MISTAKFCGALFLYAKGLGAMRSERAYETRRVIAQSPLRNLHQKGVISKEEVCEKREEEEERGKKAGRNEVT